MKKNVMMRLASFLLVAVLISTTAISGTYAKYVTEGRAYDSARVAKFGVTVTGILEDSDDDGNTNTVFTKSYATDDDWAGDDGVSVISTVDVVAPGTNGNLADFTVAGTPEVDVEVTYVATVNLSGWNVDGDEYCPIVFTINGETYGTNVTDATNKYDTVAALISAVKGAIEGSHAKYNAGDALVANVANDLAISWAWPFETGADAAAKTANNVKDTALGDAAAAGNAAVISIDVTCIVTQID